MKTKFTAVLCDLQMYLIQIQHRIQSNISTPEKLKTKRKKLFISLKDKSGSIHFLSKASFRGENVDFSLSLFLCFSEQVLWREMNIDCQRHRVTHLRLVTRVVILMSWREGGKKDVVKDTGTRVHVRLTKRACDREVEKMSAGVSWVLWIWRSSGLSFLPSFPPCTLSALMSLSNWIVCKEVLAM